MSVIKGKIEHAREHRPHTMQQGKQIDTSGPEWTTTTFGELMDKPTMTDLQKKLRAATALKDLPHNNIPFSDYDLMQAGSNLEHQRLTPILTALEGCVEALEQTEPTLRDNWFYSDADGESYNNDEMIETSRKVETALENLRKALEGT